MQEMINKMYTLARVLKLKAPDILLTVYIFFLASMFMVKKRSSNLPIQLDCTKSLIISEQVCKVV